MGKKSSHKSNLVYGLIVLIPIAIVLLIVFELVELLESLTESLGFESSLDTGLAILLVLVGLIVLSYVVGAMVNTRLGQISFERLENTVLRQVPFYKVISRLLKGFAVSEATYQAVLVSLASPNVRVIGFIADENPDGTYTVFVPTAPALTIGTLYVVDPERVTPLTASTLEVVECVTEWGSGTHKIIPPDRPAGVSADTA